jgi:hypothetical protein
MLTVIELPHACELAVRAFISFVVPAKSGWGTVQLAPVQECVQHLGNGSADHALLGLHAHQLVIAFKRFVLVGAKVVLAAIGFGNFVGIVETFQQWGNRTSRRAERFAGLQVVSAAWHYYWPVSVVSVTTSVTGQNRST